MPLWYRILSQQKQCNKLCRPKRQVTSCLAKKQSQAYLSQLCVFKRALIFVVWLVFLF